MGITHREAAFFMSQFETTGALERVVFFLNLADDPTVERLLTPRCALTVAEYLALRQGHARARHPHRHDQLLRGAARDLAPPARRSPGAAATRATCTPTSPTHLRARRAASRASKGSITQIPILTMPDDDITHPIPDLTGYITEGQIVLSRELHRKRRLPADRRAALPVAADEPRHRRGQDPRGPPRRGRPALRLLRARAATCAGCVAIVGEEALSDTDRKYLKFADDFEKLIVTRARRTAASSDTLTIGWELLAELPMSELKRVRDFIPKYHPTAGGQEDSAEVAAAVPRPSRPRSWRTSPRPSRCPSPRRSSPRSSRPSP